MADSNYESWTRTGLIKRLRELEAELKTRPPSAEEEEIIAPLPTKAKPAFDPSRYSTRFIALKLAYLGKRYGGFEFQALGNQPTIEEELWKALCKACLIFPDGHVDAVQFDCCQYSKCGRTDRGVSAFGQVISLRVRSNRPLEVRRERDGEEEEEEEEEETPPFDDMADELCYPRILNRILPPDIRILAWCPSPPADFSARFSCRERQYRYFFTQPAFAGGRLDIAAMRDAAKRFEGEHDFRNLCKVDPAKQITNFRRRILEADVVEMHDSRAFMPFDGTGTGADGKVYYFLVRGTAFLWHQIRHMVAVLFLVGQGFEKPSVVSQLLDVDATPRKPAYVMADEVPLVLWDCAYPDLEKLEASAQTNRVEDSLRWIYVGDDAPADKFGLHGVVDRLWRLWRECKMDELLAGELLQLVATQGAMQRRGEEKDLRRKVGTTMFEGGNSGRLAGKYVALSNRRMLESPEEQNERYAKRKGYASAQDMRMQKSTEREAKAAAKTKAETTGDG
ncbi:pseudouridylate synthase 3 [Ophiocordyceps camponoti-floridani]|uniref:Pseudouridylate synthase 3 n=1 Tax=Ophiocordyceps camponoti-floridani TaxID=2030778 RepID=A0A8H4Q3Z3_9HYPO|nr:pseudouridylate synthase 3 [Ophiocordyceps camponoti-floridani]